MFDFYIYIAIIWIVLDQILCLNRLSEVQKGTIEKPTNFIE